MSPQGKSPDTRSLRLWPAVALLVVLWICWRLPVMVDEISFPILALSFFGPLVCVLGILLWWLVWSRATRGEKWRGVLALPALLAVTIFLSDPSMRDYGVIGMMLPWGFTAFVLGLVAARRMEVGRRLAVALLAAAVGFGFWTLVRMDGSSGGTFKAERSWRWQDTAEERFLADSSRPRASGGRLLGADALGEAQWPGFRGPGRDAVVPGISLAEGWDSAPPRELWRVRVGPGWSSFAVAGGTLFTQEQRGDFEVVVAYDAETGAELWVQESRSRFFEALGGVGPRATPTLADGMLFTLGAEGLLHRLDPATGALVWEVDLRTAANREPPTWGFSSSPLVVDGLVIVHAGGEGDRGLLAYGVDDGVLRWSVPAGGHSYSSPQLAMVAGRRLVLMIDDDGLVGVDPTSGDAVLDYDWEFANYRTLQPLVIGPSTVLMSSGFEGTRRLELRSEGAVLTAEERWTSRGMKPDFNDYAAHDGVLYGFDPNILAAVDLATGERLWKGGRYGAGQLLLLPDADQILVISERGELVLVRATPDSLQELTRFPVLDGKTWNHPVLVGSRLYLRNAEEAVALELPVR